MDRLYIFDRLSSEKILYGVAKENLLLIQNKK